MRGFTLYTRKKDIGKNMIYWLARSRGAFWEVSNFIPRGAIWEDSYFIPEKRTVTENKG